MRIAAIDIGTNSVRMLVADHEGRELSRPLRMTRLGQGVDVTGSLSPEAVQRTLSVLREFRALAQSQGAERLAAIATSAVRDAENGSSFLDACQEQLGARPQLLSGTEEAALSFRGATAELPRASAPFLVIDLGGGSTELALGQSSPESLLSLPLGCVRMTERHLQADPPTHAELAACQRDVQGVLAASLTAFDSERARTAVGLAGTVTSLAALELGLTDYDRTRTHGSRLSRYAVERWLERLSRLPVSERRRLLVQPERAEVIVGGALVLAGLFATLELPELLVSEHDSLDGLVATLTAAARA